MCFVLSQEVYHCLTEKNTTIYTVSYLVLITSSFGTNALFMPFKHPPPLFFNKINFPIQVIKQYLFVFNFVLYATYILKIEQQNDILPQKCC